MGRRRSEAVWDGWVRSWEAAIEWGVENGSKNLPEFTNREQLVVLQLLPDVLNKLPNKLGVDVLYTKGGIASEVRLELHRSVERKRTKRKISKKGEGIP